MKKCDRCQRDGPRIHQAAVDLTIITAPCPFAQWGIDIVGPFPLAPRNRKFLIVAIDYFSKWVEAEAVAIMKFIWQDICCRHGVPCDLVSDNGTQFNSAGMRKCCEMMQIKQRFAAVAQCNIESNLLLLQLRFPFPLQSLEAI